MTWISAIEDSTRTEVADYLREFADQLDVRETDPLSAGLYSEAGGDAGDPSSPPDEAVVVRAGGDTATVDPPEDLGFGVEVGATDPDGRGPAERIVALELRWVPPDEGGGPDRGGRGE